MLLSAACEETCSGDLAGDRWIGHADLTQLPASYEVNDAADIDGDGMTEGGVALSAALGVLRSASTACATAVSAVSFGGGAGSGIV